MVCKKCEHKHQQKRINRLSGNRPDGCCAWIFLGCTTNVPSSPSFSWRKRLRGSCERFSMHNEHVEEVGGRFIQQIVRHLFPLSSSQKSSLNFGQGKALAFPLHLTEKCLSSYQECPGVLRVSEGGRRRSSKIRGNVAACMKNISAFNVHMPKREKVAHESDFCGFGAGEVVTSWNMDRGASLLKKKDMGALGNLSPSRNIGTLRVSSFFNYSDGSFFSGRPFSSNAIICCSWHRRSSGVSLSLFLPIFQINVCRKNTCAHTRVDDPVDLQAKVYRIGVFFEQQIF